MRCAADIACEKHRAPSPRSSIRAAVRAPWQLCSAARGLPAAAAAAACADHQASNLSRSLAGWRCLAACAAAPRTRPHVRWTPRRRKEGIPSTQAARAAPLLERLSVCTRRNRQNFFVLGNLVSVVSSNLVLWRRPRVEHNLVCFTSRGRPRSLPTRCKFAHVGLDRDRARIGPTRPRPPTDNQTTNGLRRTTRLPRADSPLINARCAHAPRQILHLWPNGQG